MTLGAISGYSPTITAYSEATRQPLGQALPDEQRVGQATAAPGEKKEKQEKQASRTTPHQPNARDLTPDELKRVEQLKARDKEVREHEQTHARVGAPYTGAPSYGYQQGPDGKRYAVEGEVKIDTSKIPGDPEATLEKAQKVRAAALAPKEPSAADHRVAAKAQVMAGEARRELAQQQQTDSDDPAPDAERVAKRYHSAVTPSAQALLAFA